MLVQDGTITPEDAEQVMLQLTGGGAPAEKGAQAAGAAGADEEVTPEEVVEVLQELVQDGTLQPEEAEQVLEQIVNGVAEGAEGSAGAIAPEAGAAGGELSDTDTDAKTAAVNELLIDAVNRLRRK